MDISIEQIGLALIIAIGVVAISALRQRNHMQRSWLSTEVDVETWRAWAHASGYSFGGTKVRPVVNGALHGIPFRLGAVIRIVQVHVRGQQREQSFAQTELRVSMRTSLPPDLFIHPMPPIARFFHRLFGGNAIETHPALDSLVVVETSEADDIREVLMDPVIRTALARVLDTFPEAIIDARSVEVSFAGMPQESILLDRYIEVLTTFAEAVQRVRPGAAIEARPTMADPETGEHVAVLSSAQLPDRRPMLARSLAQIGRSPSDVSLATVHTQEYDLSVMFVKDGYDQHHHPTGGTMVVGDVERSTWRAEILFDAEWNDQIRSLPPGARIHGLVDVIEADPRRKVVLGHAKTPPILTSDVKGA